MSGASGAATNHAQIVCTCGRDHRGKDSRNCLVFTILNDLNKGIREFLNYQETAESGKNGPMAHCLRSIVLRGYDNMMLEFKMAEDDSVQHPEWHLTDEIARLRSYFEQVADGCAEAKKNWNSRPPPNVMPSMVGGEDKELLHAKSMIRHLYETCDEIISDFVFSGLRSGSYLDDPGGYLSRVDTAFQDAFEIIIHLPEHENETIRDFTKKSYKIWAETRRLLCEQRG